MLGCDGCTMCCKTMKVRELDKPGDTWCRHCEIARGCAVYETRPDSCRTYECIWLQTQRLEKPMAPELRPDRSRVVVGTTNQGEDLVLYVGADRPDAWRTGAFGRFVTQMKARGTAVFISRNDVLTPV